MLRKLWDRAVDLDMFFSEVAMHLTEKVHEHISQGKSSEFKMYLLASRTGMRIGLHEHEQMLRQFRLFHPLRNWALFKFHLKRATELSQEAGERIARRYEYSERQKATMRHNVDQMLRGMFQPENRN